MDKRISINEKYWCFSLAGFDRLSPPFTNFVIDVQKQYKNPNLARAVE
jgi:hypothetical protein